jgi:hypothetical protein
MAALFGASVPRALRCKNSMRKGIAAPCYPRTLGLLYLDTFRQWSK